MSQYKTGTVNVVNGNAIVVGVGTAFLANVPVGSWFSKSGSSVSYVVASVQTDLQLTLATNYGGATENGIAYWIGTSRTPNHNMPYPEMNDVDSPTLVKQSFLKLDTLLGNAIGAAAQANRVVFTDANGNLATSANATLTAAGALGLTSSGLVGTLSNNAAASSSGNEVLRLRSSVPGEVVGYGPFIALATMTDAVMGKIHASYQTGNAADLVFYTYNSGGAMLEALRLKNNGSVSMPGNVTLGDAVGDGHTFNGNVAHTVTAGSGTYRLKASGGGDELWFYPNAAGSGANIEFVNSGGSDFEPGVVVAETLTIKTRTGVGTSATVALFGNAATTLTGPLSVSGGVVLTGALASGTGVASSGASGDLRLYANGTQFVTITTAGDIHFKRTSADATLDGASFNSFGVSGIFTSGATAVAIFNRQTDDGTLLTFRQANTDEGSISVSGTTVSYNAFLGSHWAQLEGKGRAEIPKGTVMETIDELCDWNGESNDRLPKVKVSDTPASPSVYGVFLAWDEDEFRLVDVAHTGTIDIDGEEHTYSFTTKAPRDGSNDLYVAALGAGHVRLAKGEKPARGALLESAGEGCARIQADGVVRSSTVGKVSAAVVVAEYPDGSVLVPCTLMCG